MKNFKLFTMTVVLVMLLGLLVGCGGKETPSSESNGGSTSAKVYTEFPNGFQAEKIGAIEKESITIAKGGLIYRDENGLYGILSLDGKKDTGAKYTQCKEAGSFFAVMTAEESTLSVDNASSLNCVGVVDVNGKELVPFKYAAVSEIDDRYLQVTEVTEQTTNKDEALVYYTDSMFSFSAQEGDILYKGKWYVYDSVSGKMLDGVSGTNRYRVDGCGDFVEYVTDAKEQVLVNTKGEPVPEDAELMNNGYYVVETENGGIVYDSSNAKMFEYNEETDYELDGTEEGYFVAEKSETDTYVLLDKNGKAVSAEFSDYPDVYGELLRVEDKIYNFKGEQVIEGTYESVYMDERTENAWFLVNGDDYTLIKKDGTVLYQGTDGGDITIDRYDFAIKKKDGTKTLYYNFATKEFDLDAVNVDGQWFVKVEQAEGTAYDLMDTISGKAVISGYERYSFYEEPGLAVYVYAEKDEGGFDVYTVR